MQPTIADNTCRELSISRLLNAARELVFEVWTTPEHIAKWWGPDGFTNTMFQMDVKNGGEWNFIMHGPDGRNYDNKIVYTEIVKPELIRYKHVSFPYFNVTVRFRDLGDKTLFSMQMVFETTEELQKTIEVFRADKGLIQTISKLDTYINAILS